MTDDVEQGNETSTPEWVANIEDEGLKETLSKFESQEQLFEKIGYKPPEVSQKDWREMIEDEEGKKFAQDSSDLNHLVQRAVDLRKKVSNAIFKPGKDATPEQIKAYQKSLGVPEKPDEYEFPAVPDDQLTDEIKTSRQAWSKRFHELGVPKDVAKKLMAASAEEIQQAQKAQVEADKAFAKEQEDHLQETWGDDYEKNKTLANRAFKELAERAGVKLDDLKTIETKDGRFVMDNANILRVFAAVGREMSEGSLGPVLSESEIDSMEDELHSLRKQIDEAQSEGNSKRANKLYQKEQALIARMKGDKPIVGSGRGA